MKKFFLLAMGMMIAVIAFSQTVQTWTETEDFDGAVSFTSNPQGSWVTDPVYYLPGSSTSNPQSYLGVVPTTPGSTIILQTPPYDLTNMEYIILRFSHICKISPLDTVLLQYQEAGTGTWENLPAYAYQGSANNYNRGFNATSYPEWKAEDSTALPQQSWWKEEIFDLSEDLQHGIFTFRFVIKKGRIAGTQVSYGWLLENFEIFAASHQLYLPVVEFIEPLIKDSVFHIGPFEINAKAVTRTLARIEQPNLIYTATKNSVLVGSDTVLMTHVEGDSLWKATIPQFEAGTKIIYSIIGRDTIGNQATDTSDFTVIMRNGGSLMLQDWGTEYYSYYPFNHGYGYSYSMSLYLASEMPRNNKGQIDNIALRVHTAGSGAFPMRVWLKTVPASKTTWDQNEDNLDWDILTQNATLVYDGPFHFSSEDWFDIPLSNSFVYNGIDNLVVMFEQHCGGGNCWNLMQPYSQYYYSASQSTANRMWRKSSDNNPPSMSTSLAIEVYRPDLRINVTQSLTNNSVSLYSIDMADTVAVSPSGTIPVVASILNVGIQNLSSVRMSFSVNGQSPTSTTIPLTPSLPWGYVNQYTIGNYVPSVNKYDTLKVWVSLPNNQNDATKFDDTLTKIIYGNSDLEMLFVNYPADTVTNTGPFAISARINSLTGAPIGTVSLSVDTSCVGIPINFTLPMSFDANAGLYRTNIPHTLFGSDVSYSITLTDVLGNVAKIGKSFYIKRPINEDTVLIAVAMVSINTPEEGGNLTGTIPLNVSIRNTGYENLNTCNIEWSLNGVFQSSYTYNRNLPEDFTDTVTIDNYIANLGQRDTIEVKVSMPNSVADPDENDNISSITTLGCIGDLHGIKTVDSTTGDFVSIAHAITAIRECKLSGNLTLLLKGTYNENVNLANLTTYMKGYSLTITSSNNHADSAVIQPASGVGITLGNTNNVTIKAITINDTSGTSGIQFTAACSNIVIRDCKIFTNPTATTTYSSVSSAPIYKGGSTGIVDNIIVINNILDGAHAGFYFYGGNNNQYGTRVVFDSNTLSNNHIFGMRVYNTDFSHISHNYIRSRDTNSTERWDGLSLQNVNGDIIGNRIIQRNPSVQMDGFNLGSYNYYQTTKRALIANNELIYQANGKGTGIYFNQINADFVHNSIYMSSNGEINGFYIEAVDRNKLSIRNNNIVTQGGSGYLFTYMSSTVYPTRYDIDDNNFHAIQHPLGYYQYGTISTIADLQQYFPMARNIISVLPAFVDISENTDLMVSNTGLYCSAFPNVTQDIEGKSRTAGRASMGAYQITPYSSDLGITRAISWNTEVVYDQTVSVDIEVQNTGTSNIQSAVFGWSLNGQPQPSIPWTSTTPLAFLGTATINISSFIVDTTPVYNIDVWIESINNTVDMYHRNDTLRAVATNMPLAEWAAPLVESTIVLLNFDVNAKIRTVTGAPASPPELTIITIVNDRYTIYDTLPMRLNDGIWQVSVPKQYYGSKVIYSLTVSDTMSNPNSITITDSVYLQFSNGFGANNNALSIGSGMYGGYTIPYSSYYGLSHSRSYYMAYEIDPLERGGYIRSIAFYNTISTSASCDNVSFYMKAVTDSIVAPSGIYNTVYVDPSSDGATLVWGSATITTVQGWNVFVLQSPFYLPPGKNLLIYCNAQDYTINGDASWRYTDYYTGYRSCYGVEYNSTTFPPAYVYTTSSRPDILMDIYGSTPYTGNNLAIMSMLNPVNNMNDLCTPDYSPVQAVITNLGENDYILTQDSVVVHIEIINPLGTKSEVSLVLNTDTLKSGESDTLNLMSALPIMYSGSYDIKVWIEKTDNIPYDDTLFYEFISGRIGLPVDVDFSAATLPVQVVATRPVGNSLWTPYTPNISDAVQPNPGNGTGVLRFDGTAGSISILSTRQLDLFGSDRPQLEFWYYHDTTLPSTDGSYLDVNAIVGGVSHNLGHYLHRRVTGHGWEYYVISLTQFTVTSQCVLIQFEAMNKSTGNSQYIDRIRITARQDMAITGVVVDYSVCDLQNKAWKVILTNLTAPVLEYSNTPAVIKLDILGTSSTFTETLQIGSLDGFNSDTVSLSPDFNFTARGTYQVKAYIANPLDGNPVNDTLTTTVVINPRIKLFTEKLSGDNYTNCMFFEGNAYQQATIYNIGNMDISDITMILQIDTGESGSPSYLVVQENYAGTIIPKDSAVHEFAPYKVPISKDYQLRITAHVCDPSVIDTTTAIIECVDMKDLYIKSIDNPSTAKDKIGNAIQTTVTLFNRSDMETFANTNITVLITNSQDVQIDKFNERMDAIRALSTMNYTFTTPYIVPDDTLYYLTVYTDQNDNYPNNDTVKIKRTTTREQDPEPPGIYSAESMKGITLSQNIPNPATNSTRIDYSIPDAGEVVFHVHSISGQLLYSQSIETEGGAHSIELNTSTFAAGVYFYSMEYKGQRLVRQLIIK